MLATRRPFLTVRSSSPMDQSTSDIGIIETPNRRSGAWLQNSASQSLKRAAQSRSTPALGCCMMSSMRVAFSTSPRMRARSWNSTRTAGSHPAA